MVKINSAAVAAGERTHAAWHQAVIARLWPLQLASCPGPVGQVDVERVVKLQWTRWSSAFGFCILLAIAHGSPQDELDWQQHQNDEYKCFALVTNGSSLNGQDQ